MSEDTSPLKRTPLHEAHRALGATLVPFAGWEMPVQYTSVMAEHQAVRERVGVFDISHMGQLLVSGVGAEAFLNRALTNDVTRLAPGQGQYTLLLNEAGGVIDDLIVYRTSEREFFLVVNAARIVEDWEQLRTLSCQGSEETGDLELVDLSQHCGGVAVQGPRSRAVFHAVFGGDALYPERNQIWVTVTESGMMWLCGTGYTGEEGFEFFMPSPLAMDWFQLIVDAVRAEGGLPCGLGARDTLRLEMGYPLNGNDLSPEHTPLQAGLGFAVALDKGEFVGREVLVKEKEEGLTRRLVGFRMAGKAPPPRPHYPVMCGGTRIGEVSSGTLSPTLGEGIGMVYLPITFSKPGTSIEIEIRGRSYPAEVIKKPFYQPARLK